MTFKMNMREVIEYDDVFEIIECLKENLNNRRNKVSRRAYLCCVRDFQRKIQAVRVKNRRNARKTRSRRFVVCFNCNSKTRAKNDKQCPICRSEDTARIIIKRE